MGNLVQFIRSMVQEELSEMAAPSFSIKVLDQDKAERLKKLHSGHWVGKLMDLIIKSGENGIIRDARFKTYGCGSAIASSSLVTEWVKGMHIDDASSLFTIFR